MFKNQTARIVAGALALVGAGAANAAIDLAAVTAAGADVALVGAAVFAVVVGIKVWKWVRGAL